MNVERKIKVIKGALKLLEDGSPFICNLVFIAELMKEGEEVETAIRREFTEWGIDRLDPGDVFEKNRSIFLNTEFTELLTEIKRELIAADNGDTFSGLDNAFKLRSTLLNDELTRLTNLL